MAIKKIGQTLITKPWGKLVARSEAKIAAMSGPLKQHVEASRASGEDLTAKVWTEYKANQGPLCDWRQARATAELSVLRSGKVNLANFGFKQLVQTLRFFTRFLALFLAGVMVGRNSIFPVLPSDSPFHLQLALQSPSDAQ